MKKRTHLVLLVLACVVVWNANATNTIVVGSSTYELDTVFHAKVGPGTTQTQLQLNGSNDSLQVFYLTVDKTTPGVALQVVSATDSVTGRENCTEMATRKSGDGILYFCGTNGDFYIMSGTADNGKNIAGSLESSCVVDGEIYETSEYPDSGYQFILDNEGVAHIGRLDYYNGTATIGNKTTLFKGVNVKSPDNGITLYTSRFLDSTCQNARTGSCAEVTAKLVDGDVFRAGGTFRLEVTSVATDSGDTAIPSDGFVIHGNGMSTLGCNTGALAFVSALQPGDIVEFDNVILLDNERIYPMQIVSGNPKILGKGETLDTESECYHASALHPRTGIGVSEDGNTIVLMVIDGRSSYSAGVRTTSLADIMRYAGSYEALNLDGGGSSTLYTSALGVRNRCSDGKERTVGNGIFATITAPEDEEITEIRFADWAKRLPQDELYTPILYGYNKYGVVVTIDLQGFTLSCPKELGEIVNDGTALMASGDCDGTYLLTATYNGITTSIPFTIEVSGE